MCYSHYGNGVRNGAISIVQWYLLSDCYKVNPIGQRGKILVIVFGFVDTLGHGHSSVPTLRPLLPLLLSCDNFLSKTRSFSDF